METLNETGQSEPTKTTEIAFDISTIKLIELIKLLKLAWKIRAEAPVITINWGNTQFETTITNHRTEANFISFCYFHLVTVYATQVLDDFNNTNS